MSRGGPGKLRGPSIRRGLKKRIPTDAPTIELLRAILMDAPRLPGAACMAAPGLFDGDSEADRAAALTVCTTCPVIPACRDWAASVPRGRLAGLVVAGEYRGSMRQKVP
jgi:hypothetical protein